MFEEEIEEILNKKQNAKQYFILEIISYFLV
jgi:hypothetical protein